MKFINKITRKTIGPILAKLVEGIEQDILFASKLGKQYLICHIDPTSYVNEIIRILRSRKYKAECDTFGRIEIRWINRDQQV